MTDVPTLAPPVAGPRLLAGWIETGRVADLAAHRARYGPPPLAAFPGEAGRTALVEQVRAAGLRGRGGAWFPTGEKLRAVAAGRRRAIVVANGCEGEPASEKDHALLTVAPHLALDGVVLAAHAVGAVEAVVCVHRGDPVATGVRAAIAERGPEPVRLRVVEVPGRYVASEESALVHYLNTGDARPTAKPPRPFERGVKGRPTLVDNVETLANLALIARYGPEWFRAAGTRKAPGTLLVTVGGAVARPGVRELPLGSTVADALVAAGGVTGPARAVLAGGFGGAWLPLPSATGLALTPEDLRAAGAALGVGMLLVLPERACGVAETARVLRYLAGESARQCGPCMFGVPAVAADFRELAAGRSTGWLPGGLVGGPARATDGGAVLDRLKRRLGVVPGRGACGHPDGASRLAASALRVFEADVRAHAAGRPCPWSGQAPTLRVPSPADVGEDWR